MSMTSEDAQPERLPPSNPACWHSWRYDVARLAWICGNCGYTVTEIEIANQHEGDL